MVTSGVVMGAVENALRDLPGVDPAYLEGFLVWYRRRLRREVALPLHARFGERRAAWFQRWSIVTVNSGLVTVHAVLLPIIARVLADAVPGRRWTLAGSFW